jgi:uncharacterized protein YraI
MKKGFLLLILSLITALSSVYAQDITPTATVTASSLNVRSGPSTSYAILTRIHRGESYLITGRSNVAATWWQINVNGTSGWVYGSYVTATNTDSIGIVEPPACTRYIAPSCPNTQTTTTLTSQTFEHGMMLWRSDNHEIYVLVNRGTFLHYIDNWSGQPLTQETAPTGFQQPQNGFGYLWQNDSRVRDRLGWATTSEVAYPSPIETSNGTYAGPSDDTTYLRLPDGRDIALNYYAGVWDYE